MCGKFAIQICNIIIIINLELICDRYVVKVPLVGFNNTHRINRDDTSCYYAITRRAVTCHRMRGSHLGHFEVRLFRELRLAQAPSSGQRSLQLCVGLCLLLVHRYRLRQLLRFHICITNNCNGYYFKNIVTYGMVEILTV